MVKEGIVLGHQISKRGIEVDKVNIETIEKISLMSQKLIEFLVHFYDFSYNIIANFYAEMCTIYQF